MRLKRSQIDFRVSEVLDENLTGPGDWMLYQVVKRGLSTEDAVKVLAEKAGVEPAAVSYSCVQGRDGVAGQYMAVKSGPDLRLRGGGLIVRPAGTMARALAPADNSANAFEIMVRDMSGDDMRRVRINLAQVKAHGLPAYFDDPRFGCLRHGQGFLVRLLLNGDVEGALRRLLASPSPYGTETVEQFKAGMLRRWGNWAELTRFCRGRRGASVFQHLLDNPGDFAGALSRGVATRERTIHLFAYQSHLWNAAASLILRERIPPELIRWIPTDDGALPVYHDLPAEIFEELRKLRLPLLGTGVELEGDVRRRYEAVLKAEGFTTEKFLALDLPGFRPVGEDRPLLVVPEHLRGAPAEPDDLYRGRRKMRLRFTLPSSHHPTLVAKRLVVATEDDSPPPYLWISRHRLDFPDRDGRMPRPFGGRKPKHKREAERGGGPAARPPDKRRKPPGPGRDWKPRGTRS